MHKSNYNTRKRYQDRARSRAASAFRWIMLLVIITVVGFWLGRNTAAMKVQTLSKELQEKEQALGKTQDDLSQARADAQIAVTRYQQLREEISKELPTEGPLRELVGQLRKRLEEGIDPERLMFVVQSARPPRNCIDAVTKRFVIVTPEYKGPESYASLDEDTVIVSGEGVSARNISGAPEAWFDAAKPVTMIFKTKTGVEESKTGTLPLYHSLVVGDKEYRFTIDEGARSFAKVTYDHCDYP
ncbi:MAG: hypothetical protein AB7E85_04570 [Pseudobdellovibrionaceae bacterium]